jgi:hypothetical protein
MRILVAGMVAGDPGQGGATWAVLQYVHGLRRLGHDVRLVEPVARLSAPVGAYFEELALDGAALLVGATRQTLGTPYGALAGFQPELLLNVSGMLADPELAEPIPVRVFLDLDPAFNQIWHAEGLHPTLARHTHHVTVGLRLAETSLPLDRRWIATLPPVVLAEWPYADTLETDAFTTVGHWRSYGSVSWDGTLYGQRAHAVRGLLDLPSLTSQPLLPALAIDPGEADDLRALHDHGWRLADPQVVARTPETYRRFVAGSLGEIGFAKAGYVDSRCGWFSDRSACYLASGRPVIAQDTGFAEVLPAGKGLLAYETSSQAAVALDAVAGDYERHRRAARTLAEEWLDSDRVLTRLLEQVM